MQTVNIRQLVFSETEIRNALNLSANDAIDSISWDGVKCIS